MTKAATSEIFVAALCLAFTGLQAQTAPAAAALAPPSVSCTVLKTPPSEAEAALSRNEYDKALELYKGMRDGQADVGRAGVIRTLIEQNKVKEAVDLAEAWNKAEPKKAVAAETLGEALYRKADLNESLAKATEAIALSPCTARAYLLRSSIERMMANYKRSKADVERANKLAPTDIEIRETWITTLPHKRRVEERKALLAEADLLSAEQKESLEQSVAHAASYRKDDCSLAVPAESGKATLIEMKDGAYLPEPSALT